jgi:exodeoxyribonuclease VII large subunit
VPSLVELRNRWAEQALGLKLAMDRYLQDRLDQVDLLQQRLGRLRPDRQWQRETERLTDLRRRCCMAMQHRLDREQQRQRALNQTLRSLDPHQVLQRGYSLVRDDQGAIVRRAAQTQPGDRLRIQLADGWLEVKVVPPPPEIAQLSIDLKQSP